MDAIAPLTGHHFHNDIQTEEKEEGKGRDKKSKNSRGVYLYAEGWKHLSCSDLID